MAALEFWGCVRVFKSHAGEWTDISVLQWIHRRSLSEANYVVPSIQVLERFIHSQADAPQSLPGIRYLFSIQQPKVRSFAEMYECQRSATVLPSEGKAPEMIGVDLLYPLDTIQSLWYSLNNFRVWYQFWSSESDAKKINNSFPWPSS